jgi:hypothetical protein
MCVLPIAPTRRCPVKILTCDWQTANIGHVPNPMLPDVFAAIAIDLAGKRPHAAF